MSPSRDLAVRFEAYADWRRRLSAGISSLHEWLSQQDLADAQVDVKVQQLIERLQQDKLVVAFVAEFSRGKSELINAIFFADFGQRLLPSSAGRTTMCPTELLHDPSRPPSIRLLPIETRLNEATVSEFKHYADEWVTFPLDLAAADRMAETLARVSQVKRVPVALARKYGLFSERDDELVLLQALDQLLNLDVRLRIGEILLRQPFMQRRDAGRQSPPPVGIRLEPGCEIARGDHGGVECADGVSVCRRAAIGRR